MLDGISLNVDEGEIFVLVGPPQSGKTLLAKTMINLVKKTDGKIKLGGRSYKDTLYRTNEVGYVLQEQNFDSKKNAFKSISESAKLSGKPVTRARIKNMINMMGLGSLKNVNVGKFGDKEIARLKIACALVTQPKILVLDSPFTNLCEDDARAVRVILKNIARDLGTAIIIMNPTLTGVEEICDKIGIIANGTIITIKSFDEMVQPEQGKAKLGIITPSPNFAARIIEKEFKMEAYLMGEKVIVETERSNALKIYDELTKKHGIEIIKIEEIKKSVQEEYLKILQARGN